MGQPAPPFLGLKGSIMPSNAFGAYVCEATAPPQGDLCISSPGQLLATPLVAARGAPSHTPLIPAQIYVDVSSGDVYGYTCAFGWQSISGAGSSTPSIASFTNSHPLEEIGSTVNSTTLNWTLGGGAATAQSLNHGLGTVAVGTLSKGDWASYSTNRTYTLTVTNANGSASANSTVAFLNGVYYGVSNLTSLNDAQILALTRQLQSTRIQTRTLAPNNEYLYLAWPTSYGTPIFVVNGLLDTDWVLVTRAFVNASGYSESYDIYRSGNLLFGNQIVNVQ